MRRQEEMRFWTVCNQVGSDDGSPYWAEYDADLLERAERNLKESR